MKEVISIRIDTLWKMIGLTIENKLPGINDEGATGEADNKGAIFVPGGLVYKDVDEQKVQYESWEDISRSKFRTNIRAAMRFDNATLLYPDGLAPSINLDNGFFSKCARRMITYKKAAFRRKKLISSHIADEVSSEDIIRSHCPPYMKPPYGARTRISTCISVGLVDPPMFFSYCRAQHNLSDEQSDQFGQRLNQAIQPSTGRNGKILYPPCVVVCHDTRYYENNYTGLTRVLGIGKFGEFATVTIEKVGRRLLGELKRKKQELNPENRCAEYGGSSYVLIQRTYSPTSPGRRSHKHQTRVISPRMDLGLDADRIEKDARKRYNLP
jgi:hypothetical protein